jgi:hypothetical protein
MQVFFFILFPVINCAGQRKKNRRTIAGIKKNTTFAPANLKTNKEL